MDDIAARITADLGVVVRNVATWAKDLLMEYINERIYEWGEKQKERAMWESGQMPYYVDESGRPTYQLLSSITMDSLLDNAIENYVGYTIFSDPQKMSYSPASYIHGNEEGDYRATLLERLNKAIGDYDGEVRDPWWTSTEPGGHYRFFDDYLKDLDANIYTQFEKEMTKVGWAWQRTGYVPDIFESI